MKPVKHSVVLVIASIFLHVSVKAQPAIVRDKAAGGNSIDDFRSMAKTSDGGFIIGGYSSSSVSGEKTEPGRGGNDYWVVKYDSLGRKQWDKTIGSESDDILTTLIQTNDGGFIVGGLGDYGVSGDKTSIGIGGGDYWMVKLDNAGNILWDKCVGGTGGEWLASIKQTADGGFILGGYSLSGISGNKTQPNFGDWDYWVVKTDSLFNVEWDRTLGGQYEDWVSDVVIAADGGYLVCGNSWSDVYAPGHKSQAPHNGVDYGDYWVVKLNADGSVAWDKSIGGDDGDYMYSATSTDDGGFVLAGASYSPLSGDKTQNSRGGGDYWIVKLDATGNIVWNRTMGGSGYDVPQSVQQTIDGGYVVSGSSSSPVSGEKTEPSRGGTDDYWVVKLNKNGRVLWDKTAGGGEAEYYATVREVRRNKFIVAGTSLSGKSYDKTVYSRGGSYDYWIVAIEYNPLTGAIAAAPLIPDAATSTAANMQVYPNPANTFTTIYAKEKTTITLTNASGKIVLTKNMTGLTKIDLSGFQPGVYYLNNIQTGEAKKLVISR